MRSPAVALGVELRHEPADGEPRPLATDVEVADSLLAKGIGLMGRSSIPDEYALVFEFDEPATHGIHMLLVRTPLDVIWLEDDEVRRVETLPAWTGHARERADRFVELAPGAAEAVEPDDRVVLVE